LVKTWLRPYVNLDSRKRYVHTSIYFQRLFKLVSQLGWMAGDGASANDVAVRTVCEELDPKKKFLKPKEVRIL
jgi:hypothetical protein